MEILEIPQENERTNQRTNERMHILCNICGSKNNTAQQIFNQKKNKNFDCISILAKQFEYILRGKRHEFGMFQLDFEW